MSFETLITVKFIINQLTYRNLIKTYLYLTTAANALHQYIILEHKNNILREIS